MSGSGPAGAGRFSRFVALGDSTTEGLEDPYPGGVGYRGWADRLAEQIAAGSPGLGYANLAIRGRKLSQIRAEQLGPAVALDPDLASILGGLNDVLRRSVDLKAVGDDLEAIVTGLRAGGAAVLMFTYPDPTKLITVAAARIRSRVGLLNARIRRVAAEHQAVLVDLELEVVAHPSLWSPDRLHANARGHERIAAAAAEALGVSEPTGSWATPLVDPPPQPRPLRLAGDAAWVGRHLAPWLLRRLRGRSSGDGVEPKRPALDPIVDRPAHQADTDPRILGSGPTGPE